MGASALGALGIDCRKKAAAQRAASSQLNGKMTEIIRRNISKTSSIIFTLIYKAEATGDPSLLRIRNRELEAEIDKLRLEDIPKNRELEEMRALISDLRKEVDHLKDKVDDAEEETRKARESQRICQRKIRKMKQGNVAELVDMTTNTEEPLPTENAPMDLPRNNPVVEQHSKMERILKL